MNDAPASGDPQRAGRPDRSPAAADVAGTLSDLERKLRELEIELSSVRRPAGRQPAAAPSPPPPPPPEPDPDPPPVPEEPPPAPEPEARLVDEGLAAPEPPPPAGPSTGPPRQPPPPEPPPPVGEFARSPAAPPPPPSGPPAELVAEVRERIAGVEAQLEDLMRLRREIELRAHALETGAAPATAATPPPPPSPPPPPPIHTQPPRTPPEPAEAMFEGPVVLEVGPLPDIASVAELELKLTRLAQVISAHVRSYAGQRAVVDLQLAAPTPLPRHLRDALGAQLSVLDSASGRLSVVIDTGTGLGPSL